VICEQQQKIEAKYSNATKAKYSNATNSNATNAGNEEINLEDSPHLM